MKPSLKKSLHANKSLAVAIALPLLIASGDASAHAETWTASSESRRETVTGVGRLLSERYVSADLGRKMEAHLRSRLEAGAYDGLDSGEALARQLTEDAHTVYHDRHLRVRFSAEPMPVDPGRTEPAPEDAAAFRRQMVRENVGFERVEVLPGNIGYLKLNYFGESELGGPRAAGAMEYLQGTGALIVDIRQNGGALDPGMIAIVCSYFFPPGRTHLNSLYWREGDRTEQSWTLPSLPAPRYLDRPIYVLTSRRTFSGAEEFAYNLQTRGRAVIVGDTTGGGANPGGEIPATRHFAVWVPTGRAINPVTGTNWEGVGVKPDVAVRARDALIRARELALQAMLPQETNDPGWKSTLDRELARLQKERETSRAQVAFKLSGYEAAREVSVVGAFNDWTPGSDPLHREGTVWTGKAEVEPGRHSYKFWVDGQWLTDPANADHEVDPNGYTNSVLTVRGG